MSLPLVSESLSAAPYTSDQSTTPTFSTEFGNWFVGFFDGEGSFKIEGKTGHASIQISLKRTSENLRVLQWIQENFGCGVTPTDRGGRKQKNAQAIFRVARMEDVVQRVIPLFDAFELRGPKRLEYPHWRNYAVFLLTNKGRRGLLEERRKACAEARASILSQRQLEEESRREFLGLDRIGQK